ncbi:unnamed protein product [Lampetra fluviatilis]
MERRKTAESRFLVAARRGRQHRGSPRTVRACHAAGGAQRSQGRYTSPIRVQPRAPPPPPPTLHAREWIECPGSSVHGEKSAWGDTACLWLAIVATVGNILVVAVVYACSFYEV